jgi:uncharacterized protein YbbC (DUF1343 family)
MTMNHFSFKRILHCRKKGLLQLLASLVVLAALSLAALPALAEPLLCGIDRLEASRFRELSGLRVGLITNAASLSQKGEPSYRLMLRSGVELKFLMAPEHGFSADVEAGKKIGLSMVSDTLQVVSLYGASRKPDIRQLRQIDLLVFDLQDVGTRCYTYISTMKSAMEACEEAAIPFMVLDRPNPVIPLYPQGFMLKQGYASFVGAVDIPFVHSMTVGEIALLLKERCFKKLDLRVIAMQGYGRQKFGDEYEGFSFRSPSPNIRSVDTAILYPATVFLEATTVSEGRGTDAPFVQFGAPFIRSVELADALGKYRLAGVSFTPVVFQPNSGKFSKERCHGLKLSLSDRKAFSPFRTATALLLELQRLYPAEFGLDKRGEFFDQLAGTSLFRKMIKKQLPLETIMEESRQQVEQFNRSTSVRHLYP